MASKIDIFSQALVLLGEAPISSFDEGVPGVVAGSLYETTRDSLLTSNRWRFAVGKADLSRLTATPLNEWSYAFQLPSNMLMPIQISGTSPYEIFEDKLYTNTPSVQLEYVFSPPEESYPVYFVEALAARLAEVIAVPITNNLSLRDVMSQMASVRISEASFRDAQGRPVTSIVSNPFSRARN